MKIAVPLTNGVLSAHFGHCEEFALLEIDKDQKTILGKTILKPPAHEPGVLPRWLGQLGVNVIIAGGMEKELLRFLPKMISMFWWVLYRRRRKSLLKIFWPAP